MVWLTATAAAMGQLSVYSPSELFEMFVLFRFMMDIVAPVGVFQVWDAASVAGRRWFRLLCDTTGFMLL
jgi:hypothetical protein